MNGQLRLLGQVRPLLLTLLMLGLAPTLVGAETVLIRNECPIPLGVQVGSVFKGVLRRDPPQVLKANEIGTGVQLPGNKIINVLDPRNPNRVLFQVTVPEKNEDQHFGIVADNLGRFRLEPRRPFNQR
jgi:hypothetical protein